VNRIDAVERPQNLIGFFLFNDSEEDIFVGFFVPDDSFVNYF
jgi:hypothetical protein